MRALTELRSLDLRGTKISDAGLAGISELATLHSLNLAYTKVSDGGLDNLKRLTNLQLLYLHKTDVTDAGVNKLKKSLPNCEITPLRIEPPICDCYKQFGPPKMTLHATDRRKSLLRLPAVRDNAAMQTEPPKTAAPKRKRRWFQFSLRSLMIGVTMLCILLAQSPLVEWEPPVTATFGGTLGGSYTERTVTVFPGYHFVPARVYLFGGLESARCWTDCLAFLISG